MNPAFGFGLPLRALLWRRAQLTLQLILLGLLAALALLGSLSGVGLGLLLSAGLLLSQSGLTRQAGAKLLLLIAALGLLFLWAQAVAGSGPLDPLLLGATLALPALFSLGAVAEAGEPPVVAWLLSWALSLLLILGCLGALQLFSRPAPLGLLWLLGTQPAIAAAAVSASAGATREGRAAALSLLLLGVAFASAAWVSEGRPQPLAPLLALWLATPVLLARASEWSGGRPRPALKRLCGLAGAGLDAFTGAGLGLPIACFVAADALSEPTEREASGWQECLRSPAAAGLYGALIVVFMQALGGALWGFGLFSAAARLGRRVMQPMLLACVLVPPVYRFTEELPQAGVYGLLLLSWAVWDRARELGRARS